MSRDKVHEYAGGKSHGQRSYNNILLTHLNNRQYSQLIIRRTGCEQDGLVLIFQTRNKKVTGSNLGSSN
jgi:hypothetical protein